MLTFYFLHFQYEETLSGEENNVVNGRNCIDQCQRVISEYPSLNDHPSSIGMNANLPVSIYHILAAFIKFAHMGVQRQTKHTHAQKTILVNQVRATPSCRYAPGLKNTLYTRVML